MSPIWHRSSQRGETYDWRRTLRRDALPSDGDFPTPALFIEGVHFGGGEPFALDRRLIALPSVPDIGRESFVKQAPGSWLLDHILGYRRATASARLALRPPGSFARPF
jgi:hypothetical protein